MKKLYTNYDEVKKNLGYILIFYLYNKEFLLFHSFSASRLI